jgi:5-methylcytosine-specific restriction protein A
MPSRAPLACTHPGCPSRAEPGTSRCTAHPYGSRWAEGAHGRAMPAGWAATRLRILDRDWHRCRACGAPATVCDHVRRGGGEDDDNLQSLCQPCSDRKTAAEAAEARTHARYG